MSGAGVFRGDHYKDGSVAGHWRMEMCTVIKCDPGQPDTCRQVPTRDTWLYHDTGHGTVS